MYELKLRCGRTVRASANHPFRTIHGWKSLRNLYRGDRIAVPRHLLSTSPTNPLSKTELELLAHLIGDGCTVPRQPIHYTSADPENIRTVALAAKKLFGIEPRIVKQQNWWHAYLPAPFRLARGKRNPITQWLIDLGVGLRHSWEKQVPLSVFNGDSAHIAHFLHHLWATDGNVSWKNLAGRKPAAAIYYSSTSQQLADDVQHLLLQLGIHSTTRAVPHKKYRTGYQVHVQGRDAQIAFLSTVGCAGQRGNDIPELLFALKHITANTNTDTIPRDVWQGIVAEEKERAGLSWREVQAAIDTKYCGSTIFKSGIGRERMTRLATVLRSKPLKELAVSGVIWDEVVSITKQEIEEVYDATVPGVHNFVANDIIVHNSIEQDADVVMFLHRQLLEEGEERPEVMEVDLLIEKHRNGPTGLVPLNFHSKYVTYTEVDQIHARENIPTASAMA
ncbi:MAG: LAGLIDADG family homing endonuclease [Candidatus Andersenbacteria bacterium]